MHVVQNITNPIKSKTVSTSLRVRVKGDLYRLRNAYIKVLNYIYANLEGMGGQQRLGQIPKFSRFKYFIVVHLEKNVSITTLCVKVGFPYAHD